MLEKQWSGSPSYILKNWRELPIVGGVFLWLNLLMEVVFVLLTCVVLYQFVDAKTYAKPWRLFAVSLIALLIGTQFQHVFDGLVRALEKAGRSVDSLEDLRHFISLLNVMLTGMGGALLGAAVSNRAQQCYLVEERKARSEIRELRANIGKLGERYRQLTAMDGVAATNVSALLIEERLRLGELEKEWPHLAEGP